MIQKRRGAVAILVAVCMIVVLGFAAIVVDVGAIYNVRGDLQRTADSCALAAASAYLEDDMYRVRTKGDPIDLVIDTGITRAIQIGKANSTLNLPETNIGRTDIVAGYIDLNSNTSPISQNVPSDLFNAFFVKARKDETENGPVNLYFAAIFGKSDTNVTASAVAAFDDRFSGVKPSPGGATILPFTIHEDAFNLELAEGQDQYSFDDPGVSTGQDAIIEIRLFPYPLSGTDHEAGDGNFGFLNIGNPSQSAAVEKEQILDGITAEEVQAEFGSDSLLFYDEDGNPLQYAVEGSPGLEVTVESEISTRIGEVIAFFLHNEVILNGANATYTITNIVYARVMDVKLTGAIDNKYFYVQPVSYGGSDIIVGPDSPSSNGTKGRIVLVR